MKKLLLSLVALMTFGVSVWAEDGISVPAVEVKQGSSGTALVYLNLDGATNYNGFQLTMTLPAGITTKIVEYEGVIDYEEDGVTPIYGTVEGPDATLGSGVAGFAFGRNFISKEEPQKISFAVYDGTGESRIKATDGKALVLQLNIDASSSLDVDDVLTASITDINLSTSASKNVHLDDITFEIKIVENIVILDETSTELPEIAENQKVLVKRTINANEWSTLCLPFDMTAEQVAEIFGSDAQFAEFEDYTVDEGDVNPSASASSNATNICINFYKTIFDEEYGFMANNPYLIKTSKNITEFTVEDVTVDPSEDIDIEYATGSGSRKKVFGHFYGTMKSGETIPANGLFLSGGDFWYSTGATVIKAFRGYFVLNDVLANLSAGVKMQVNVDGKPTRVNDLQIVNTNGTTYTIDGKKISNTDNLPKGVYIIDGKKVAIK